MGGYRNIRNRYSDRKSVVRAAPIDDHELGAVGPKRRKRLESSTQSGCLVEHRHDDAKSFR